MPGTARYMHRATSNGVLRGSRVMDPIFHASCSASTWHRVTSQVASISTASPRHHAFRGTSHGSTTQQHTAVKPNTSGSSLHRRHTARPGQSARRSSRAGEDADIPERTRTSPRPCSFPGSFQERYFFFDSFSDILSLPDVLALQVATFVGAGHVKSHARRM